jgi:hypothetical protein
MRVKGVNKDIAGGKGVRRWSGSVIVRQCFIDRQDRLDYSL